LIIRLEDATGENAGSKAATLGRLAQAGFPVPPAFVIPVDVYRSFVSDLDLSSVLADQGATEACRLIESKRLPPSLLNQLSKALTDLGSRPASASDPASDPASGAASGAEVPVAVRSSATSEDTVASSAAGQHDTYLGVQGLSAVADAVRATWASLWTHRAITYRQGPGTSDDPAMAVIVQRLIDAEVSGVLFTAPTPDGETLIEASWGLGESVVQGLVTPDAYTLTSTAILERHLGTKQTRTDRTSAGPTTTAVAAAHRTRFVLTDPQLHQLRRLGQRIAEHLGAPQDIEFAQTSTHLWLLQSRPITAPLVPPTLRRGEASRRVARQAAPEVRAIRGTAGSAGLVSGPARLVEGPEDFRRVQAGDILVCRFTDPAWTPLFKVVAGVITETGGRLSHAAIVAREHRIPAVLGVPSVMSTLHDGQPITLDGTTGTVHPTPQL
jgi:pyruvate, water dikinase